MAHKVYISLGSNLGDRQTHLQLALELIHQRIGVVDKISSLYETPAWGFVGETFYNACVSVTTLLSANYVLEELLNIEKELGRERNAGTKGYQSRTIDLDILFYDDEIIKTENLNVPHPQIHNRNFVLFPLNEIASNKIHPIFQKSIEELLKNSPDASKITKISNKISLKKVKNPFKKYNYITIEGNIGSGKTTLATKMAQNYQAELILEQFSENPFLPKFYQDAQKYGFVLEISFLMERYQQMKRYFTENEIVSKLLVTDYDISKSLIFSKITLGREDFLVYEKSFHLLYDDIVKPDLYVYLYQNTERIMENIKKRGREYEKNISKSYLDSVQQGYLDFLSKNKDLNSLIIDVTELDFVEKPSDYDIIIEKISNF